VRHDPGSSGLNSGACRVFGDGAIAVGNGSAHERIGVATVEGFAAAAHREPPDRLITALGAVLAVGGAEYPLRRSTLKVARPGVSLLPMDRFADKPIDELQHPWLSWVIAMLTRSGIYRCVCVFVQSLCDATPD